MFWVKTKPWGAGWEVQSLSSVCSRDPGARKRPPKKEVSTQNGIAEREDEEEVEHPGRDIRRKG